MSQKFISLLPERARAQEEEPLQKSFDLNAVEVVVHLSDGRRCAAQAGPTTGLAGAESRLGR